MDLSFDTRLQKIEQALSQALNMEFSAEWKKSVFANIPQAITTKHIQNLIQPNKELIDLGGKRWRPLFMILCYELLCKESKNALPIDSVYKLTPLVEFVHTASLIHDDIEDSADLRRGKPAAHITFGLDTALNAGSWLYFVAPVSIDNLDLPAEQKLMFYQLYTLELRKLHLGQAMDIFWHREKDVFPTMDEYKAMVKNKTGTLASLAAQTGILASGQTLEIAQQFGDIAANIGIGFQIIDDVINLTTGNVGKKRGDDIVEGKKSLPILIHIHNNPQDKEKIASLMKIAQEEGIDSSAVEECISVLETSDCIQLAAKEGISLIKSSCQKFGSLLKCDEKILELIKNLFEKMVPGQFK